MAIAIPLAAAPAMAAAPAYNLPDAVTGTMAADEVLKKMETAVKPEVLEAFKQQHPANFWLFGEDRQLAVRNRIIPAHWFEHGAKQYPEQLSFSIKVEAPGRMPGPRGAGMLPAASSCASA